jgi:chromosome segregation ATPase
LNDDNTYLKDLTGQCELKAREWDQRSKTRNDELEALGKAIGIISGKVKGNADDTRGAVKAQLLTVSTDDDDTVDDAADYEDVVFVQKSVTVRKSNAQERARESQERKKAVSMIRKSAEELNSVELNLLAMNLAADPFAKVKGLIQKLIERLLKESADEATQKGFCDTSLAKANTDRDYRQGDLDDLAAEINALNAHKAELEEEHSQLTDEKKDVEDALMSAQQIRNQEKADNKDTLDKAKAGLKALKEAIGVLENFYKGAAKGEVSLVETSASPVDVDRDAAGGSHLGSYKGNQAQAGGILGMLATIQSDFEKTIKVTKESEAKAAAAMTKLDRESKGSIQSKSTGLARNTEETIETTGNLQANLQALKNNQDLLDESLRSLAILRPKCIDTKMSYAERVARREKEIVALKKAVCVLDKEDDEVSKCSGEWSQYAPTGRR